jgi:hypothetical protein
MEHISLCVGQEILSGGQAFCSLMENWAMATVFISLTPAPSSRPAVMWLQQIYASPNFAFFGDSQSH